MPDRMHRAAAVATPSRNDMDMQMPHRLPAGSAVVPADVIAIGLERFVDHVRDLFHPEKKRPDCFARQFGYRGHMRFGYHDRMPGSQRMNIQKGDDRIVFKHRLRRKLVADDFAEDAIHMIDVLGSTYHVLGETL